jgi:DNA-binding transcriptional LysR family regulator
MTPTQLRAFATVVRLGSVKSAAADLSVSEAAVSMHIAHLRKELGDKLFTRTGPVSRSHRAVCASPAAPPSCSVCRTARCWK